METQIAGKLLVAMPGIGDPRFDHAVIMMCQHEPTHAMGLIVNKPKEFLTIGEVLDHLGISAAPDLAPRPVLDGGPVRPERGFVLHSQDYAVEDATQEVAPGVSLTATRDVLEVMASPAAPARFMLALGCSSWGAGQLEDELKRNAWLLVDCSAAIVFGDDHAQKWTQAIRCLGVEPSQLLGPAGRA